MMIEDADLLRRYAELHSEEAFAELVRRRIGLVYAVALRQVGGDAHLAEDVTQRVFADLARKAAALSQRAVLSGWLYRSAQFAASDLVRTERRRRAREEETHIMNESSATEMVVDWDKVRPVLDETLGELADEDRDAVALRFFENRPFAEIGRALSVSEDAARKRVDRALDKLHGLLARRGVNSTAAALGVALAGQSAMAAPAGLAASVTGAALAGATAGAVGVGGILTFMSTSKPIAVVASLAAVLAVGVAVLQTASARRTTVELASMSQERDALRAAVATAELRARSSANESAAASQPAAGSKPDEPKSREETGSSRAWQPAGVVEHVLDHPQTRAAFVRQQVLAAGTHFERFFSQAGISPQLQEEFFRRVAEQAEAKLDFVASVRAQGYGPNNPPQDPQAYMKLMQLDSELERDFQARLQELFGAETYRAYSAYRRAIPEMNVAGAVAARLYDSASPLTAQQATDLVRLLNENRYRPGDVPQPNNSVAGQFVSTDVHQGAMLQSNLQHGSVVFTLMEWQSPITDAAIARLEAILSGPQLAVLKGLQAGQLARLQLAPPPPPQPDIQKLLPKPGGKNE